MIKIRFKNLGVITLMAAFVIVASGCEDNQKVRNQRYGSRYMAGQGGYGVNQYEQYGAGRWTRNPSEIPGRVPGGIGAGGAPGNYPSRNGAWGGGQIPDRQGGILGGSDKGAGIPSRGKRATRDYPYVIDKQEAPWKTICSNPSNDLRDDDNDGICNEYENKYAHMYAVHSGADNGFKVSAVTYLENSNEIVLDRESLKRMFVGAKVSVIKGGWEQQPTNWGTKVKGQYLRDNAQLPYEYEVVNFSDSTFSRNTLLEKDGSFSLAKFPGFSADNDSLKEKYVACTSGWFRKPSNVDASLFWIHNVDDNADDAVAVYDNGELAAFSHKEQRGIFKRIFIGAKGIFANTDTRNVLEHKIADNNYHLLEFCFYNRKSKGQGEVRYMRDASSTTSGFIPLSPVDFRVESPTNDVEIVVGILPITDADTAEAYVAEPAVEPAAGNGTDNGNGAKPQEQDVDKLDELLKKREELSSQLDNLTNEIRDVAAEKIKDYQSKIAKLQAEMARLQAEMAALDAIVNTNGASPQGPEATIEGKNCDDKGYRIELFRFTSGNTDNLGLNESDDWLAIKIDRLAEYIKSEPRKSITFYPIADGGDPARNRDLQEQRKNLIERYLNIELEGQLGQLAETPVIDFSYLSPSGSAGSPNIRLMMVIVWDKEKVQSLLSSR